MVRGLLARLVPGHGARTAARQAAEFDAAAREAYHAAQKLETGAPPAPAPPADRSAGASASAPPTVPVATPAAVPAHVTGLVSPPTTPATSPTAARAPAPTTPDRGPATTPEPSPTARTSVWATPPRLPEEQSAALRREPPEESPAPRRRRQPGDTAPDFLLRTPTSVAPVADDFFDSLIQRVEGDRLHPGAVVPRASTSEAASEARRGPRPPLQVILLTLGVSLAVVVLGARIAFQPGSHPASNPSSAPSIQASPIASETTTIPAVSGERGVWLMEEGSGTTIVDSSGLGNTGTLTGSPLWTAGRQGLGLHLNGTSDYATCPNGPSLDIQGPITLAAWVKPERVATRYVIKKATAGADGYELSLSATGKVFFRLNQATSGNTYRIDSTTSYPANGTTWMHIAATYDGTTMRLYINGVQEATIAGPAAIGSNGQRVGIGAQPDGVSPLQGTLDEVRIWARALTATEIQGFRTP